MVPEREIGLSTSLLFLCTGNSCRSQMAEGFARKLLSIEVDVFSAGTEPTGVNPHAVRAMREVDIDISSQRSKSVGEVPLDQISLVITLCGDAAERCPVLPGARVEHWPLPDPARATGDAEEINAVFRNVRDEIDGRVQSLAVALSKGELAPPRGKEK